MDAMKTLDHLKFPLWAGEMVHSLWTIDVQAGEPELWSTALDLEWDKGSFLVHFSSKDKPTFMYFLNVLVFCFLTVSWNIQTFKTHCKKLSLSQRGSLC